MDLFSNQIIANLLNRKIYRPVSPRDFIKQREFIEEVFKSDIVAMTN